MNENKVIRQISDYTLDELNEHMATVYKIPDYIMDFVRRQYWIDQIKMFKNIILDNMEQKTCIFDRHVKVQKWIDGKKPSFVDSYNDKYIWEISDRPIQKSYHNFYFDHREEIEKYFLDMIEKTGVGQPDLNGNLNLELNLLDKFKKDEEIYLEE